MKDSHYPKNESAHSLSWFAFIQRIGVFKYVVLRPVTKQNFLVLNLYNNVSQPYELWF